MTIIDSVKSYYSWFGVGGVATAMMAKLTSSSVLITVKRPEILFPFYLRCRTSDIQTFEQIYIRQDYDFEVEKCPKVIVDAGANIGLSSIYFANRYPESQIFAIEPEMSNYEMLKRNRETFWHCSCQYGIYHDRTSYGRLGDSSERRRGGEKTSNYG